MSKVFGLGRSLNPIPFPMAICKSEPIQKPYPNFHAARVKSPGLFLRVRVFQTTKEGIMIYGGPLKSDPRGPTKVQSIRFPKDKYTPKTAKKWLKDHKQKYTLFEPASVKKVLWPTLSGELK